MVMLVSTCDYCKHYKGFISKCTEACDAFPEGLPKKFWGKDKGECNNGIGFECAEGKEEEYKKFLESKK